MAISAAAAISSEFCTLLSSSTLKSSTSSGEEIKNKPLSASCASKFKSCYVEFDSLDIVAVARYGFKAENKTFNIRRQANNCTLKREGGIQLENVEGWQAKTGNIPNWIAAGKSRPKQMVILYYAEVEGMALR